MTEKKIVDTRESTEAGINRFMNPNGRVARGKKLLEEGKVVKYPEDARVYIVEGVSGTYAVFITSTVQACTCIAHTRCYHLEAAVAWEWGTVEEQQHWAAIALLHKEDLLRAGLSLIDHLNAQV